MPSLVFAKPAARARVVRLASDRFELVIPDQHRLRILQITDTHFGTPNDANRAKDRHTQDLIRELIETHQPDYVFHTGDFINNDQQNPEHGAIDFMNDLGGLPWSVVFGNHDHPNGKEGQKNLDRYFLSLGSAVVGHKERSSGGRDYCYRVDLKVEGSHAFASLLAFNTGAPSTGMKVNDSQTEWFLEQMEGDKAAGITAPVLVMQHIPTIEYKDVFDQKLAVGRQGETVCFELDKGEIFSHYADSKRVRAVFCGHDHVNDYLGALKTVNLVYGRCTGYSGYGDWERGARLIDIDPRTGSGRTRVVLGAKAQEKPEWSRTLTDSPVS